MILYKSDVIGHHRANQMNSRGKNIFYPRNEKIMGHDTYRDKKSQEGTKYLVV